MRQLAVALLLLLLMLGLLSVRLGVKGEESQSVKHTLLR
jgi:hypothetical protein